MPGASTILVGLALIAFAGNSILCRLALRDTGIDPVSFTAIRIVSGALMLWIITVVRRGRQSGGSWRSAFALFVYAAAFSYAYLGLSAATGALLLFAAVQVTMIGYGLWRGERLTPLQILGVLMAFAGVVVLLLPGLSAPPLLNASLMLAAGVAWGVYSLRGKGAGDATAVSAGNFLRAAPIAVALLAVVRPENAWHAGGVAYALASGALASGAGYAIWYAALPHLRATTAATVQLAVPILTAAAGILLLGEPLTARWLIASVVALGGIALAL